MADQSNHTIISREQALELGLTQYFTGKSCNRGHISNRFVSDRNCSECKRLKQRLENVSPEKREKERLRGRNRAQNMSAAQKEMHRLYQKRYKEKFPERAKERTRHWIQNNPDRVIEHHLKRYYGISFQEKIEFGNVQDNKCAGCQKKFSTNLRDAHVDHDHERGFGKDSVRGLLCVRCNFALGYAKDSPETLRRLADYVSKTCSACGLVRKQLSLAVREWKCDSCGSVHQRDENAAKNIAFEALRDRAGRGCVSRTALRDAAA